MSRKKYDYLFLVFFAVTILFAFILGSHMDTIVDDRTNSNDVKKTSMVFEGEQFEFYYEFDLPDEDVEGKNIAFNTSHLGSEVSIDGTVVYSCAPSEDSGTDSTGYRWNFIKLRSSDNGGHVVIRQTTRYKGVLPDPDLYYGEVSAIYGQIIKTDGIRMTIAACIFIIGVLLLFYSVFILRFSYSDSSPIFFSVASILLAMWAFTNARAFPMIFPAAKWGALINHYSLMLIPIAFLQFLRQIYSDKENALWDYMEYLGAGIVLIRTFLELTNIAELRETLVFTQVYICLFAVVGISLGIREIVTHKITKQLKFNIICLMVILLATFFEILVLRLFNKDSIYGTVCFLIYVLLMALDIIKQSMKMRERANENEIYRQLAFTDELTGVFNRTAFKNDLDKQVRTDTETGSSQINSCALFMFDLNDLKKCNDKFGHEKGDEYIKTISDVIASAFGFDGRCYRIGGDEFSVIAPYTSQNDIDSKLNWINRRITEINRKKFVVTMSVSVGYAVYDEEKDENLDATLKRADEMMYENKRLYKEKLAMAGR